MIKDDYIKMRNSQKYDLQWFYNYWEDNDGKGIDINRFGKIFNTANLDEILNYLDKKFDLFILVSAPNITTNGFGQKIDTGSKFIKCYE
jgi:hypothetical protein